MLRRCSKASELADGPLFSARRLVDKSYHGHYIVERQRFQDSDLEEWEISWAARCRGTTVVASLEASRSKLYSSMKILRKAGK